ncbi:MAG: hypothetical protein A2542_02125 [Parcubacteria group bacterium RIFOXYD2_FULL_52_8]|nr:MAG: hypothetical protein A2542_02125 [Parcubacteria group bacterium RIFOXYD2_FULL_52_8]
MNAFQTVLLVIFGTAAVIGTILFSGYFDGAENSTANQVLVWGTLPQQQLDEYFDAFNKQKLVSELRYEQIPAASFDNELVEALAEDKGPDLIFLTQDLILRHQGKIAKVPYDTVSARTFTDTFIEEGELYRAPEGILGFPLLVDPLVMYWNRDLFTNAELAQAPKAWEQVLGIASLLTKKDERGNVTQSAVALGGFANIRYAKEVLTSLFLQAEQPLVVREGERGRPVVALGSSNRGVLSGGEAALQFFAQFSNPVKNDIYTWNSALRLDTELFKASRLALYFAPFSELHVLREENPHLNFDIAQLPQRENGTRRATFGTMYAVAPLKSARNVTAATQAALALAQAEQVSGLSTLIGLPPARRDLLAQGTSDASKVVAYRSAIIASGWLDPSPRETSDLFRKAIDTVVSGVAQEGDAISQLAAQLGDLLPRNQ